MIRIVTFLITVALFAAVIWQTVHVVEWCLTMWEAHGDGSLAAYLRMHAHVYVSHIFGGRGWIVG